MTSAFRRREGTKKQRKELPATLGDGAGGSEDRDTEYPAVGPVILCGWEKQCESLLAHTTRRNDDLLTKTHKEGRAALAYVVAVVVEWWPPQQAQYSYKTPRLGD